MKGPNPNAVALLSFAPAHSPPCLPNTANYLMSTGVRTSEPLFGIPGATSVAPPPAGHAAAPPATASPAQLQGQARLDAARQKEAQQKEAQQKREQEQARARQETERKAQAQTTVFSWEQLLATVPDQDKQSVVDALQEARARSKQGAAPRVGSTEDEAESKAELARLNIQPVPGKRLRFNEFVKAATSPKKRRLQQDGWLDQVPTEV